MTELKFTEESNSIIHEYFRKRWALPAKLVRESPLRKFPWNKRAKSYVEGGERIYNAVIEEFISNGFPTELPVTEDLIKINDTKAWQREGITSQRKGEFFVFTVKKEDGRVPTFVRKMRELKKQIEEDNETIKKARSELLQATEEYRQKLQLLIGPAAVLSFSPGSIELINMNGATPYYGRRLERENIGIKVADPIIFKHDSEKLWEGVFKN